MTKATTTRKTSSRKSKKPADKKNIIIAVLGVAVAAMAVGYAAFATTLTISGTATIVGEWDVEITNIEFEGKGQAKDGDSTSFNATAATFDCELYAPGDECEYTVTVQNKGSIKAVLDSVNLVPDTTNSEYIDMVVTSQPSASDVLNPNGTHTVVVTSTYKDTETAPAAGTSRSLSGGTLVYKQAAN